MIQKLLSIFTILALTVSVIHAQYVIIKTNGDEIQAKVTEVDNICVKYKKFNNQSGPSYAIQNADIFMIRYENGDKDLFEKNAETGQTVARHLENKKPVQDTPSAQQTQNKPETPANPPAPVVAPAPVAAPEPTGAKAQFQLGLSYEKGQGIAQDNQKAADWYLKAAEQGYADAQYNLGVLYTTVKNISIKTKEDFQMRNGAFVNAAGLPMDQATAQYWWRKAAAQGHVGAKAKLKEMEPAAQSVTATTKSAKTPSGSATVATLKTKDKTYQVNIGEIGKDEKGNTTVDVLADGIGIIKITGSDFGSSLTPPLWAKIMVNGKIISAENGSLSSDHCVFYFNTSGKPDKVIVYDSNSDTGKPEVIFDMKAKK